MQVAPQATAVSLTLAPSELALLSKQLSHFFLMRTQTASTECKCGRACSLAPQQSSICSFMRAMRGRSGSVPGRACKQWGRWCLCLVFCRQHMSRARILLKRRHVKTRVGLRQAPRSSSCAAPAALRRRPPCCPQQTRAWLSCTTRSPARVTPLLTRSSIDTCKLQGTVLRVPRRMPRARQSAVSGVPCLL